MIIHLGLLVWTMPFFQNADSTNAPGGQYNDTSDNSNLMLIINIQNFNVVAHHSVLDDASTIQLASADALQSQLELNTHSSSHDVINSRHRLFQIIGCTYVD